jgi:hypothetical protein
MGKKDRGTNRLTCSNRVPTRTRPPRRQHGGGNGVERCSAWRGQARRDVAAGRETYGSGGGGRETADEREDGGRGFPSTE